METQEILSDAGSRRSFFRWGGVALSGGTAMFLGACGSGDAGRATSSVASAGSAETTDIRILNSALDLEHLAIYAYTAGAKILKGAVLKEAKLFLSHEKAHAAGLEQAIKGLGGTPNAARASYPLGNPKSQTDVLKLANMIENIAVKAYVEAIPQLARPELRATAAAIVTNEAQHIAVLRFNLGKPPVPSAFVAGNET
jgi:bacterioferritin (cytochrome b1)